MKHKVTVARHLWAVLMITVAACSPSGEGQARNPKTVLARHAESGLPVIPLTAIHANQRHVFKVEVAASDAEQEKGLMFRTQMAADEGMIFPTKPARRVAFWMKNTVMPLDIIFIGADHRILNVAANAVPYSLDPIPSQGAAAGVLELNAGRAKQLGLVVGDRVEW